jgi:hypothetical protein
MMEGQRGRGVGREMQRCKEEIYIPKCIAINSMVPWSLCYVLLAPYLRTLVPLWLFVPTVSIISPLLILVRVVFGSASRA